MTFFINDSLSFSINKVPGFPSFFSSSPLKSPLAAANGFGEATNATNKSENRYLFTWIDSRRSVFFLSHAT